MDNPLLPAVDGELGKTLANLTTMKEFQRVVSEHITAPFDVPTPKEKVKRRPDGYDYIESSWMDKNFKQQSPLYSHDLLHYSEAAGWITVIVRVTDRITGNSELGASSVRIQVKQGTIEPTFRDIVDKGNNVTACLTRAIKNAQSRFGHGADVYGKKESAITDQEKVRYESMYKEIAKISQTKAQLFKQQWEELGVDYSVFLDKWQVLIDRNHASAEKRESSSLSDSEVTEASSQEIKTSTAKVKLF